MLRCAVVEAVSRQSASPTCSARRMTETGTSCTTESCGWSRTAADTSRSWPGVFSAALLEHVRRHRRTDYFAPLDIVLVRVHVVQPDVVYFGPETVARLDPLEYSRPA